MEQWIKYQEVRYSISKTGYLISRIRRLPLSERNQNQERKMDNLTSKSNQHIRRQKITEDGNRKNVEPKCQITLRQAENRTCQRIEGLQAPNSGKGGRPELRDLWDCRNHRTCPV